MSTRYIICPKCANPSVEPCPLCGDCGTNLEQVPPVMPRELAGAMLEGRYQLTEYLDEGAMAYVYRGVHVELGSSVAVKILKPSLQAGDRFEERFQQEARAAGALNHPNILSIITVGSSPGGLVFLISEFVQGITLNKLIAREGTISLDRTVRIGSQILTALDEAHSQGIIHRDIKPENIMITQLRSREEFVKLLDFGIARQVYQQTPRLTMPGELFGTPEFMAPEVIRGQEATIVSDLYAVGVILYEMLTGELPFIGEGLFDVLKSHLESSPRSLQEFDPEIPSGMDRLVKQALSKNPAERPQSAMDFKFMLQNALLETPVPTLPCPKCHFGVTDGQRFCPNCGTSVAFSAVQSVTGEPLGTPPLRNTLENILLHEQDVEMTFVGREDELEFFNAFMYQDYPILEINGPAGIGKTAFLRKASKMARAEGIHTLFAGPDSSGSGRPWYPVRKLFRDLLSLGPEPSESEVLAAIEHLSLEPDDVPHVVQFMTAMPAGREMERSVRLRERLTSVLRLILAMIGSAPHLLFFDDVHEYDYMSRMFVDRLVSVARGFPLKVLVASETPHIQPGDIGQSLILKRLDDDLVRPLIQGNLQTSSESYHYHVSRLCQAAMGLPLHIQEGIHLLLEGGTELTSNLTDLVQLRIRRLPPKAMRILQLASCYGTEIPVSLLQSAEGMNDAFHDALRVLLKRGFLTELSAETVGLGHPLYARIVPSQMTATVRLDFHAVILDLLEMENAPCHLLASHALSASLLEQAVPHLECAGNDCEDDLDDYSAIECYKQAFNIVKIATLQGQELGHFAHLSARLGDLYRFTGQNHLAEEVLKEGLLVCEDSPDEEAVILSSLARLTMSSLRDVDRAGTLINRATRKVSQTSDPALIYRVYFDLSAIEMQRKRYDHGARMLREGLKIVSSLSHSPLSFWRLFLRLAEFEFEAGHQEEAIGILMNALSVMEHQRDPLPRGRIHYLLGQFFLKLQRLNDAQPQIQKAVEYLQKTGDRQGAAEASLTLAQTPMAERDRYLDQAMYLSMQIGWKQGIDKVRSLRQQPEDPS